MPTIDAHMPFLDLQASWTYSACAVSTPDTESRAPRDMASRPAPGFLSKQVRDASYYYLNLTPRKSARIAVVCGGREECRPDYAMDRTDFRYHSIEFVSLTSKT